MILSHQRKKTCLLAMIFSMWVPLLSAKNFESECESSFSPTAENPNHSLLIKNLEAYLVTENSVPPMSEVVGSGKVAKEAKAMFGAMPQKTWQDKLSAYLDDILDDQMSPKITRLRQKIAREYFKFIMQRIYAPSSEELATQTGINASIISLLLGKQDVQFSRALDLLPLQAHQLRQRLAQVYATKCRETGQILTFSEWAKALNLNESQLSWVKSGENTKGVFSEFSELSALAQTNHPRSFSATIHSELKSEEKRQNLIKAIETKKRLIVTTALSGAKVDEEFFAVLESYCVARDAHLIVIPANMTTYELDPILLNKEWVHILTHETELLPTLRIANLKISPSAVNPIAGIERLGRRGQSVIVGAPKIFEKVVATVENNINPHRILSTGAVTAPAYGGERYIPRRGEQIAQNQHRMGAVVVERHDETESEGSYHIRHIEFLDEVAGFTDAGIFYGSDGEMREARYAAVTPGDLHIGQENKETFEESKKLIRKFKPKAVVLHDVLNSESINPYVSQKPLSQAQRNLAEGHNLVNELDLIAKKINEILALDPQLKIYIVRSNHDLWLDRWLSSGEFMKDPENQSIGLALAQYLLHDSDANAFEIALKKLPWDRSIAADLVPTKIMDIKRVVFLGVGESMQIGPPENPVQVGMHGHKGARGSNGVSLRDMQMIAGRSLIGHTHTIGRANDAVNGGTSTELDMGYNRDGASDWVQAVTLVSENGEIQVLALNRGKFFASKVKAKSNEGQSFFPKGYPKLNPNRGEDEL